MRRVAGSGLLVVRGLWLGVLVTAACGAPEPDALPDAGTAPLECTATAPIACPDPMPTYAEVAPIFEQRCIVCHKGEANGPWSLRGYSHVVDWEDTIRSSLLDCTMPPPDAGTALAPEERQAILDWIRCGVPQ